MNHKIIGAPSHDRGIAVLIHRVKPMFFKLLWFISLGIGLTLCSIDTLIISTQKSEAVWGCDSFGYLSMARSLRESFSRPQKPQFFMESHQTQILIQHFKDWGLPLSQWDEVVAPHAYHYHSRSGHVGAQYPPGTGLILSLFPEGKSVQLLNAITVVGLWMLGMILLYLSIRKGTWISAGFLSLCFFLCLDVLRGIRDSSYSINASLSPIVLAVISFYSGLVLFWKDQKKWAYIIAFFSGTLLGVCVLIRLQSILLLPAFLSLLISHRRLVIPFGLGMGLLGGLPLLLHQHWITGAWYLSTYNHGDTSAPTLSVFLANASYFLGRGPGAGYNWVVFNIGLGVISLIGLRFLHRKEKNYQALRLRQVLLAGLIAWLVPTIFFLTHKTVTHYYLATSTVASTWIIAMGLWVIESQGIFLTQGLFEKFFFLLAGFPGVLMMSRVPWPDEGEWRPAHFVKVKDRQALPKELQNSKSWIWADMSSGNFWYDANKPAFKIAFADPSVRSNLFQFIRKRKEPQFLVVDSDTTQKVIDELRGLGAILTPMGKVFGSPYFRIQWRFISK